MELSTTGGIDRKRQGASYSLPFSVSVCEGPVLSVSGGLVCQWRVVLERQNKIGNIRRIVRGGVFLIFPFPVERFLPCGEIIRLPLLLPLHVQQSVSAGGRSGQAHSLRTWS